MPNTKITGTDLVAICSGLRESLRTARLGSIEEQKLSEALAKLIDLNTLEDYELVPLRSIPVRTPSCPADHVGCYWDASRNVIIHHAGPEA